MKILILSQLLTVQIWVLRAKDVFYSFWLVRIYFADRIRIQEARMLRIQGVWILNTVYLFTLFTVLCVPTIRK